MQPTVFIIQEVRGRDLSPARKFGDLRVMLNGKETNELATSRLERWLKTMGPQDYLLLIGNPVFIGIATHLSLLINDGRINVLVWDREHQQYNSEKVEI